MIVFDLPTINFSAVAIAALAGAILTVFFAYFPKVRVWFAGLMLETQSLVKLGLMSLIALIMWVVISAPVALYNMASLAAVLIALILTNQPVAALLPATRDVKEAALKRLTRFLHGD